MPEPWVSDDEVASHLGVAKDTIDRKKLPAHRVGRLGRFEREEVDAWIRSGGASDSPPKRGGAT